MTQSTSGESVYDDVEIAMAVRQTADYIAINRALRLGAGLDGGAHPHLKMDQLSDWLQCQIGKHFFDLLDERTRRGRTTPDDRLLYLAALENFGVDCPHILIPVPRHRDTYICRNCDALIMKIWKRLDEEFNLGA